MRVRVDGKEQEISLDGPLLGRGGEASIYAVPGRSDVAAKIYHNPSAEHAGKLAAMLAAPPLPPPQRDEHVTIAWPLGRLLETGNADRVIGYLMPRIDKTHLIWEIYNPGARRDTYPHFHYGSLLRAAQNLAAIVAALHECGYVLGDLNESNVLVSPQALVTLIDADSFQVPGGDRLYRCRVGRPEYTPPELQGVAFAEVDRLPQHDDFALAVLVFQLLMQGIHPFAGSCAGEPDSIAARIAAGHWPYTWMRSSPVQPSPHAPPWFTLPPSVQDLLRRCFEDAHAEPDLRPTAEQWRQALEQAEQELTTCALEPQHLYHRGLDRCPWCVPSSAIRHPPSAIRQPKRNESQRKAESRKRKAESDPLPPSPEMEPAAPQPTTVGAEMVLQAIGANVEKRAWLMWLGTALLGAVAGVIYALR